MRGFSIEFMICDSCNEKKKKINKLETKDVIFYSKNKMFNAPNDEDVKYLIVKKKRAHRKDEATIYSTTNDFKINFNSQSKKTAFDESATFNDPSGDERQYDICGIKHLTYDLIYHGKATRQFDQGFFWDDMDIPISRQNINSISTENFNNMKSFYFRNHSCHGAYYDTAATSIFDEIQKKLKACKGEIPKCFVSLVKPKYEICHGYTYDENGQRIGLRRTPGIKPKEGDKTIIDLDDIASNKDKYFDYYYVTPNAVYKVDHELVHNRVDLIEEGVFSQEWRKHVKKKCFNRCDFKEFYDYKNQRQAMINAYNARMNSLQTNTQQNNI